MVAGPAGMYAPEGFESVSVSLPSSWASSSTGTETVFSASPAAKVSAPLVAVQSEPAVAVPSEVA